MNRHSVSKFDTTYSNIIYSKISWEKEEKHPSNQQ
jgi:hypothetical protein